MLPQQSKSNRVLLAIAQITVSGLYLALGQELGDIPLLQCPNDWDTVQLYFHATHCDHFYKCENGTLSHETCPNGLLFDGKGNVAHHCNYEFAVDCVFRKERAPPISTPNCLYLWGIYPVDTGCNQIYYTCMDGIAIETSCEPGLVYDHGSHTCISPHLTDNCNNEHFKGMPHCPEPYGLFGVPRFCDQYMECYNGNFLYQQCPDGLVFNAKLTHLRYACDYPVDVDCSDRPELQPPQPSPHCPRKWGMFPDENPSNCGIFWNCVDGRAFQFQCAEGLAFSTLTNTCDYPDKAPTCDAEAYLGFRCPSLHPAILHVFLGDTKFPHPRDCQRYFLCVGGKKPRLHTCPNKQVYNPIHEDCDDPINVHGCESYYGSDDKEFETNFVGGA